MRWADRHPWLVSLVLILVVAVPGYLRLEGTIDRACEDRRDQALLLRDLVNLSDDDSGGFNLTGIPSYKQLDRETQRYLADLEAASKQAPDPDGFVKNALALLDIPTCD